MAFNKNDRYSKASKQTNKKTDFKDMKQPNPEVTSSGTGIFQTVHAKYPNCSQN